jgi:hypothetical protein
MRLMSEGPVPSSTEITSFNVTRPAVREGTSA